MKRTGAVLFVLLAIAGGIVADRLVPARQRSARPLGVSVPGGLLACPIATAGGPGVVWLANLGARPSVTRVSWVPARGASVDVDLTLPPGGTRELAAPSRFHRVRTTAVVEYSGTDVVASHAVYTGGGAGAEACVSPGASTVVVEGLRTRNARSTLVIANPGRADADVSATLIADGRTLSPVRLSRRVIRARSRLDFDLSEFVFGASRITAVVHANSGRIAAEAFFRSAEGALLIAGQEQVKDAVMVAPRRDPFGNNLVAIGDEDSAIDARIITVSSQGRAAGAPPTLSAGKGVGLSVSAAPSALALNVTAGSPVAGYSHWIDGSPRARDRAGLPILAPAPRWAGVIGAPKTAAARLSLMIVNPSDGAAVGTLRIVSADGDRSVGFVLPAGRIQVLSPRLRGITAIALSTDQPVAVMLHVVSFQAGVRHSLAVAGVRLMEVVPAAVVVDQRIGVPVGSPDRAN